MIDHRKWICHLIEETLHTLIFFKDNYFTKVDTLHYSGTISARGGPEYAVVTHYIDFYRTNGAWTGRQSHHRNPRLISTENITTALEK